MGAHFAIMQEAFGFDIKTECAFMFASPCGDGAHRICKDNLKATIARLKPEIIIPMGYDAIDSLLRHVLTGRMAGTKPSAFIGRTIPDPDLNAWVCPTYSPWFIAEMEAKKSKNGRVWQALDYRAMLKTHVQNAVSKLGKAFPVIDQHVNVITDLQTACKRLQELSYYKGILTLDFETSGLKPHRKGHFIDCVGITVDQGDSTITHAMPFFQDLIFQGLWRDLMVNPAIKKNAHNASFEAMWDKVRGSKEWIVNWHWDTCIGAHCIDNTAPVNLKFWTYCSYGISGYDSEVDSYLKSSPSEAKEFGANAFNRVQDAPLIPKLKYCGLDTIFTHHLQIDQSQILRKAYNREGFKLFMEGMQVFTDTSHSGMPFDETHANKQIAELAVKNQEITSRILKMPEMLGYSKVNLDSDKQCADFLYKTLGIPETRFGAGTDAQCLKEIGTPLTLSIIERRKFEKTRSYLDNYLRESVDNTVHPFFNLQKVVSYRSSSDSPNAQNIPKRDKYAKKAIRSCYRPSPGNILVEWDLKGAEVGAAASITGDRNLIMYQTDYKNNDMHKDCAKQIFFWDDTNYQKSVRGSIKNGWTFPEFYGSTVNTGVAENLWYDVDQSVRDWMAIQLQPRLDGLLGNWDGSVNRNGQIELPTTYTAWCAHLQEMETDFWGNRFGDYKEWKMDTWKFYRKHGFVDLVTGFRCHGPMAYNDVTNYPIQGPAFHINLKAMLWNSQGFKSAFGSRSRIIGQIHDSQIGDIHPDDLDKANEIVQSSIIRVRETFKWIKVPIVTEWERTDVDEGWDMLDAKKGGELVAE